MANTVTSTGGVVGSPSFAQADKFLLSFARLPNMTFMCQEVNLPGVNLNPAKQPTQSVDAPLPGSKFKFEPMTVTFLIDEDFFSWTSIFDWLQGIGFPDSSQEYANLPLQSKLAMNSQKPQYSDATLCYFDNQNNPVMSVEFNLMFPTGLSGVQFDVKQPATTPLTATATFQYTRYQYKRINYLL